MKSLSSFLDGPCVFVLLAAQAVFVSGCTSVLWDDKTFAHYYRPANPVHLRLFYSSERKDVLVQFDEGIDGDNKGRPRCYWLEPNTERINKERKPHFVSQNVTNGLIPIAVKEIAASSAPPDFRELCAVARRDDDFFTLYSGDEQLDPYKLPAYSSGSLRVMQVLLTPIAVGIDTTIIGAVMGLYYGPMFLGQLSR